tara:strand:+ start:410 stop:610 length:201 start_codon:yes stop_codon:yes gene_type:complete
MNFCRDIETVVEPVKMNELNTKAMNVLDTKGDKAFIEHVFTHPEDHDKPKEEKRQLSYAEMRMLYG